MTTRGRLGVLVGALLAFVLSFASTAGAASTPVVDATPQEGADTLQIADIDAKDPKEVRVRFVWNGDPAALSKMTVRQNGEEVAASNPTGLADEDVARSTVFVLDQSSSMVTSGALDAAVARIKQIMDDASPNERFGLVTFGAQAVVAEGITKDRAKVSKALDEILPDPARPAALWDAVVAATQELDKFRSDEHNLIVVTNRADRGSTNDARAARGAVAGSGEGTGTMVFAIGIEQPGGLDRSGLAGLVESGGGRLLLATRASDVGAAFDRVVTARRNEFVTVFPALPDSQGLADLTMTVGSVSLDRPQQFPIGGVASGATRLAPTVAPPPSTPAFFSTTAGLVVGLLLCALAIGVVAYIAIQMVTSRQSALEAALNPYTEGYVATETEEEGGRGLSENALLQRALAMTESFAEQQGFLQSVETKLEMAAIPLRASEALLIWFGAMIVAAIIGFVLGGLFIATVFIMIVLLLGPAGLNFRGTQLQRRFEAQLPDTLMLLAGALRAGFSLMQAVDAVAQEVQDPMGKELQRVVTETRLGRELEDAFDDAAERMGSPDFAWTVMAIKIQREVGGNLAELLLTVADTMIQRERLRREVKALTAEGRISAYVIALLPPALGVVMYIMNPDYMRPLFSDILGQIMLAISVVGMVVGFLWMQKVVQIDV